MPLISSSVVRRMIQSTRLKNNVDMTHPCLTPVWTSNKMPPSPVVIEAFDDLSKVGGDSIRS